MNLLLLYGLLAASSVGYISTKFDTSKGWLVPQLGGSFDWVTKEQFEAELKQTKSISVDVKFYLYTNSNPSTPVQIPLNDGNALSMSNFNIANPTRFIIHGWLNNFKSDLNPEIRNALLNSGSYNVFFVDWSSTPDFLNYISARIAVPDVGKVVANFIDFLSERGMSFSTLTLYGHGMGAHISGYAGKSASRGKISTIIGMDPAFPLFSINDSSSRLSSTDASYVEVIHTNGGLWGILQPIGQTDFYANGGKFQLGCGFDLLGLCSHGRAHIYVAEGISRDSFSSYSCPSSQDAVNRNCGSTISRIKMASPTNKDITGSFYTPVNSRSPFGKNL